MKDKEFLQWIHNRMAWVHGENPSVDYMHKLRAVIAATDESIETPNAGSAHASEGCNTEEHY